MNKRDLLIRREAFFESLDMAQKLTDGIGRIGYGIIELFDGDGQLKSVTPFSNLITDVGDMYYAQKCIAAISPANAAAPTAMAHMKLGTGSTAAAKSGAGAAIVTSIASSSQVFDTTGGPYPTVANLGAGLGVNCVYKTTWAPGAATNSAITEAVISSDTGTGGGTAANSICRAVFAAQNKQAADTLALTWNHKNLGA